VDDGLAPDGDIVGNFAMAGANSVVSIAGTGGAEVVHYDPATGTYGAVIAADTAGGQFYVFGVDPAARTVLVDDVTSTDSVELYDTRTGTLLATVDLSGDTLKGGVVDAARGRADLLVDASTGDDTVLTVSMTTGAVTAVTNSDGGGAARAGSLDNIALDTATGDVYLSSGPGSLLCFGGGTSLATVDPGAGTATVTNAGTRCDTDLAVDPSSGNLVSVSYRAVSVNFAGSSSLVTMPESNPSADSVFPLRTGAPAELAVDPVNHLALVMYELPTTPS